MTNDITEPRFRLSDDQLKEILQQAYREGIETGKQLLQNSAAPKIDSEEFNPMRLFQTGKHPKLGSEISNLVNEKHNMFRDDWVFGGKYHPEYDFRNFYTANIQKAIRSLVLASYNASKNGDIPRAQRKEALHFYDSLTDQWLSFADKHLPTYTKEDAQNE